MPSSSRILREGVNRVIQDVLYAFRKTAPELSTQSNLSLEKKEMKNMELELVHIVNYNSKGIENYIMHYPINKDLIESNVNELLLQANEEAVSYG